jgi:hypothetical protein
MDRGLGSTRRSHVATTDLTFAAMSPHLPPSQNPIVPDDPAEIDRRWNSASDPVTEKAGSLNGHGGQSSRPSRCRRSGPGQCLRPHRTLFEARPVPEVGRARPNLATEALGPARARPRRGRPLGRGRHRAVGRLGLLRKVFTAVDAAHAHRRLIAFFQRAPMPASPSCSGSHTPSTAGPTNSSRSTPPARGQQRAGRGGEPAHRERPPRRLRVRQLQPLPAPAMLACGVK